MNSETPAHLPVPAESSRPPSSPAPPLRVRIPDPVPPTRPASSPPFILSRGRSAALCLILVLGLCTVLLPAVRTAWGSLGGGLTPQKLGETVVRALLEGGLPPVGLPPLGDHGTEAPPEPTAPPDTAPPEDANPTDVTESPKEPEDEPSEPDTVDPPAEPDTSEALSEPPKFETPSAPSPESATADLQEPPSASLHTTSSEDPVPDPPAESVTASTQEPPTDPPSEPPTQPDPPATSSPEEDPPPPPSAFPEGCIPVITVDCSEPHRGSGYVQHSGGSLPPALPTDSPWNGNTPTVLLVNTHPYEGYSDGSPYYDPAAGSLALTDTPNHPRGVVALASALARDLRGRGVTVIHLRVAVTPGESAAETYDRTEAMIRYYCRLYPDIGLVLDLRRSAELTEDGGILRTCGQREGKPTAQLRISVSGDRPSAESGHDLAVALSLRAALWAAEPTVSRPVRIKSGAGLIPGQSGVRVLTLDWGSAGNTFDEAASLTEDLGRAIAGILPKNG